MSGLAGQIRYDGKPVEKDLLVRMGTILAHRGNDDAGVLIEGNTGLTHQCMALTGVANLTSASNVAGVAGADHQPMMSADGGQAILLDGAIINRRVLWQALQSKGSMNTSSSDAGVILQYYRERGIHALLEAIDGMFAFVLVDYRKQTAYLVRDRAGIKPLYYCRTGNCISFASEIKALSKTGVCKPEIDAYGLKDYLHIQLYVGDKTLFKNIHSLEPGKYAEISLSDNRMTTYTYWAIPQDEIDASYTDALYQLRHLVDHAVKTWMDAGVPLASTVSGGLDSAIVSSIAKKYIDPNLQDKLSTYSSIYPHMQSVDESAYSDLVAGHIHSAHHRYAMDVEEIVAVHQDLMYVLDMPVAGYAAPYRLMSREIRKDYRVVLNGNGGDELFCGYPKYMAAYVVKLLNGGLEHHKNVIHTKDFGYFAGFEDQARDIISNSLFQDDLALLRNLFYRSPFLWDAIHPDIRRETEDYEVDRQIFALYNQRGNSCLKRLLFLDQKILLPGLLHVEDRTSSAEGMESRTPLLDRSVMEFAARMPDDYLLENGLKGMLRHVAEPLIPYAVTYNAVKSGMIFPVPEVLENRMKNQVEETILTLDRSGLFQYPMAQIMDSLKEKVYSRAKWGLYCLAAWYNTYID